MERKMKAQTIVRAFMLVGFKDLEFVSFYKISIFDYLNEIDTIIQGM